jgi:hypothetical protein
MIMALEPLNETRAGQHTRGIGLVPEKATEHCPWCHQPITRSEYNRIRGEIEAQETDRIAKVEQTLKDRFARERERAETAKKAEIEKARTDAAKAAEEQIKALKASQEAVIDQRLETQREAFEKSKAEAINAEKVKLFAEKLKLEEKLLEMQRALQKRTAADLGEEGEVDLFDALRREFPGDNITRVAKGVQGADIIHRVVHNGSVVGTILIDSKNTSRFMKRYVTKLRADQLRAQADFAILSTTVFPQRARQLAVKDNVILADPARVVAVVHLLRASSARR